MPIHDWTRVTPGIFHHFHHDWITMIGMGLNAGRLPKGYYALAEQIAGGLGPDVLTLENPSNGTPQISSNGAASVGVALAEAPPKVRFRTEIDLFTQRKNRIAIRHSSDHRVVAVIEIVSPENKASRHALRAFVDKALELIDAGVHLLVIDLFPPGPRDPQGIHQAIWSEFKDEDFVLPEDKALTLVSYSASLVTRAFIEPVAVGDELPEMPLFFEPERYVLTPLASTYQAAWEGVPAYWRERITL